MSKKQKPIKQPEGYVISENGYFIGMSYGGKFEYSFDKNQAKPLTERQFHSMKFYCDEELLFEIEDKIIE
jgi:hypothetical protein